LFFKKKNISRKKLTKNSEIGLRKKSPPNCKSLGNLSTKISQGKIQSPKWINNFLRPAFQKAIGQNDSSFVVENQ